VRVLTWLRRALPCLLSVHAACDGARGGPAAEIILGCTTSLYDSGLLDALLPAFATAHAPLRVKLIAVGSGQALELGRRRDVDVLLVHSPEDEERFMNAGHGVRRLPVMRNEFVLVGPPADPAGVRGAGTVARALRRLAVQRSPFISRGDSSGTHRRELELWYAAGIDEDMLGFRTEVGQGMGEALGIASERAAYTLTDRATFLALSAALALDVLLEGGPALDNPYSVITVAHARNAAGADAFADWITSPAAAVLIRGFGRERYDRPLFEPAGNAP
jgi:tungstate transport system substrate-binding protein